MQDNYQNNQRPLAAQPEPNPANQQPKSQSNLGMDYPVDMVFCIDATGSMEDTTGSEKRIINLVKENALHFFDDFSKEMEKKGKHIRQLRIRIIAFRDYLADGEQAMMVTDFFMLPQQTKEFEDAINSISAMGGGDLPEDGLEALAYAIRSDWVKENGKRRQVIVVWTDAGTHDIGYAKSCAFYPKGMPENMTQLSNWWEDYMHQNYKRLVIFAPDEQSWSYISRNWENVIHFPSVAGNGLAEQPYSQILDALAQSC